MTRILRNVFVGGAAAVAILWLGIEILEARQLASTRIETDNGIESLERIELGGVEQSVYLRGHDRDKPVMLFVHGGPGSPFTPLARGYSLELEKHFIVVHWDQRGAGNSCSSEVPNESLTLEQHLSDTLELVHHLRERFDEEAIFLVGHSWGSVLGVKTVQRHPEFFHAYVGLGQVVNMKRNEELSYEFVLAEATKEQNELALKDLVGISPPYSTREDLMLQREWLSHYHGDMWTGNAFLQFALGLIQSPEYGLLSKLTFYSCAMNSIEQTWGDVQEIDFLSSATQLGVPVFFLAGRHDYNTPFALVEEYFEVLDAPYKELVWFENSAHSPNLEEPEKYQQTLIDLLLPVRNR